MTTVEYDVDPQLRAEFIDESLDGLSTVAGLFVELERDPSHTETVEAIFRVAHSIKGNAAYFNLLRLKTLAHEMETLLDLVRKAQLSPGREVIDALLAGIDELTAILQRAREDQPEVPDEEHFQRILDDVCAAATGGRDNKEQLWQHLIHLLKTLRTDAQDTPPTIQKQIEEAAECTSRLAALTPEAGKALGSTEPPADLPKPATDIQAIVADAGADEVLDDAAAKEILDDLKALREHIEGDDATALLNQTIENAEMFIPTVGVDLVLREILTDMLETISTNNWWKSAAPPEKDGTEPASSEQADHPEPTEPAADSKKAAPHAKQPGKTMRVTEESIDAFLGYVGEFVVIGEMYDNLQTRMGEIQTGTELVTEMRRVNESFDHLSTNLQRSIMEIRKMPMRGILQRAPRLVRDIATSKGKEIEVNMVGEDLMADKSIVDTLEAPLVHMVRNSADHGIELPDEREAAGKTRTGTIEISARETSEHIELSIHDDGKGLDREALRKKAVSLNLVAPEATMGEQDIVNLLFMSGVSTAQEVTDVSGRGVGMDVVKRNIEGMGGSIRVQTEDGLGSAFTVQMPKTVTTQILAGFVVVVAGERYVLPLDRIRRCFHPKEAEIQTVQGRGECIVQGDQVIAITRFGEVCGIKRNGNQPTGHGILVIVEADDRQVAILVDDIDGVKQVVLKDIEGLQMDNNLFLGGAVMGSGKVAMIVDVDQLVTWSL